MARVAVIDSATNIVVALIIAEASDPPYAGTFLVDADHAACDVGWLYDPVVNDFVNPNPPEEEPLPEDGGV
jgi:hypothetical protein